MKLITKNDKREIINSLGFLYFVIRNSATDYRVKFDCVDAFGDICNVIGADMADIRECEPTFVKEGVYRHLEGFTTDEEDWEDSNK